MDADGIMEIDVWDSAAVGKGEGGSRDAETGFLKGAGFHLSWSYCTCDSCCLNLNTKETFPPPVTWGLISQLAARRD